MPDAKTPAPATEPQSDTPTEELAAAALAFIASLRKGPAEYAERPGGSPALSGAALATSARYIAGPLGEKERAADREAVVEYLHSKQRASSGAYDDVSRETPTWRRLNIPLFGWVVRALAMLDGRPARPANFLGRWDDPDELARWLGLLEWHRAARRESLRVMNISVPRVNAFKRGRQDLESSVEALFTDSLRKEIERAQLFYQAGVERDLIQAVVNFEGGSRHLRPLERIDLNQDEISGIGLINEGKERRVTHIAAIPICLSIDFDGMRQKGQAR